MKGQRETNRPVRRPRRIRKQEGITLCYVCLFPLVADNAKWEMVCTNEQCRKYRRVDA